MAEFENRPFGQNAQPEERARGTQARGVQQKARPEEGQHDHSEGRVARAIEDQTARAPSDVFLWSALGAMAGAAALQLAGQKHLSLFLGQWVAPLLLFGVYNKIVKVAGSDATRSGNGADRTVPAY